jgi:CheY-like chemotaxis protein
MRRRLREGRSPSRKMRFRIFMIVGLFTIRRRGGRWVDGSTGLDMQPQHILLLVDNSPHCKYIVNAPRSKDGHSSMKTKLVAHPALLLADDNPALLTTLVEMLQTEYRVIAALPNGSSVLDQIVVLGPDVVILDISLGDLTGFEVARRLKDSGCPAKIIFLTVHEDIDFVTAAFDIGACGYVFKSRVTEDLTRAIDAVCNGRQFISINPPEISQINLR